MEKERYLPEGAWGQSELSLATLEKARATGRILEAKAILCDSSHNLVVDLGDLRGVLRDEDADGILLHQVILLEDMDIREPCVADDNGRIVCHINSCF